MNWVKSWFDYLVGKESTRNQDGNEMHEKKSTDFVFIESNPPKSGLSDWVIQEYLASEKAKQKSLSVSCTEKTVHARYWKSKYDGFVYMK